MTHIHADGTDDNTHAINLCVREFYHNVLYSSIYNNNTKREHC